MSLEIVIIENEGEWQAWTPDTTGAIVGIGATREIATQNAIDTLHATANELTREVFHREDSEGAKE